MVEQYVNLDIFANLLPGKLTFLFSSYDLQVICSWYAIVIKTEKSFRQ
jgi:hypothetical protein